MSGHRRVSQAYKSDISERVGPKKMGYLCLTIDYSGCYQVFARACTKSGQCPFNFNTTSNGSVNVSVNHLIQKEGLQAGSRYFATSMDSH